MLTDLAAAARKSGLRVIELDGWASNRSGGNPPGSGVLCHHTGAYDALADATNDLDYAKWMAFTGRTDLDPPLCNLALSAEGVVYVTAAGNANHAGQARASGPMPAAADGNELYIGIEAMNSGSQGWESKGTDADGNEVTQGQAYARLCAALCRHYGWPASHVRAHRETSVTGKPDPGLLDMDDFRAEVARLIRTQEDDDMPYSEKELADIVRAAVKAEVGGRLDRAEAQLEAVLKRLAATGAIRTRLAKLVEQGKASKTDLTHLQRDLDGLADG